jgi:protease-4
VPSLEHTLSDKVGVRFDSVKTGPFAAGLNVFFDHSPEEARKMQASTEQMYEIFLAHVAKGRSLVRDSVHAIAQGRVWSGRDALGIGLVDRLGGLDAAVRSAAKLARLKGYRIAEYPTVMDPLQQIIQEFSGQKDEEARTAKVVQREVPELYPMYQEWQAIRKSNGVQARLPFMLDFR